MATSAYCPLECRSPTGFGASRRTQERPHGQRLGNGLRRPSLGPALPAPLGLGPDADMNGCQSGGMTTRWKPRLAAYQEVLDVTLRYFFRPAWRSIIRLTMRVCGQAKDCLSCVIGLAAHQQPC